MVFEHRILYQVLKIFEPPNLRTHKRTMHFITAKHVIASHALGGIAGIRRLNALRVSCVQKTSFGTSSSRPNDYTTHKINSPYLKLQLRLGVHKVALYAGSVVATPQARCPCVNELAQRTKHRAFWIYAAQPIMRIQLHFAVSYGGSKCARYQRDVLSKLNTDAFRTGVLDIVPRKG